MKSVGANIMGFVWAIPITVVLTGAVYATGWYLAGGSK